MSKVEESVPIQQENPGDISRGLAGLLASKIAAITPLVKAATEFELVGKIDCGDEVIEFAAQDIEEVEPAEKPGSFMLKFKEELNDNKNKVFIVTGAALVTCATALLLRKKNN